MSFPTGNVGAGIDMTPVVHRTECPYCHRFFEHDCYRDLAKNPKIVCDDCMDAYDAKVRANFKLELASENAARRVAGMEKHDRRRTEILSRWRQLSNTSTMKDRCHFEALLDVVRKCDLGMIEPLKPKAERGEEW